MILHLFRFYITKLHCSLKTPGDVSVPSERRMFDIIYFYYICVYDGEAIDVKDLIHGLTHAS